MNQSDSIIEALGQIKGLRPPMEMPSQATLDSIRASTIRSLTPVRPLPANSTLILLGIILFSAFSLLAASLVGLLGYHHLSLTQKLAYYGVILLCGSWLSAALVTEIIPGSIRRMAPVLPLALPPVLLSLIALALFPKPDFTRFSKLGLPCLELGTLCAAVSGLLVYLLLRRGFITSLVRTALSVGLLAGLAGFAVLALHCPVLNIAHIVVWHGGPMLIAVTAGALIGLARPVTR